MADIDGAPNSTVEKHQDFRINIKSKRIVIHQLAKYKSLLMKLFEHQPELNQSDVEKLLQEMLLNFEVSVQENISVAGFSWEEATEENSEECSVVDDLLDEKVVQTSWKRSIYPKKILPYFVRSLKAERTLMGLFENAVKPQELERDPDQDAVMSSVSAAAPKMFREASTILKSLKDVKQTAERFHQVLSTQLSSETLEAYREVFSTADGRHPVIRSDSNPANTHTIKRATAEREYSTPYTPLALPTHQQ